MIRSARLQAALGFGAKHLDSGIWRGFHELIRRVYIGPARYILSIWLCPKGIGPGHFQLIVRHSVTQGGDFNAFVSDLDLSVVLADAEMKQAPDVVRRFQSWKSRLPFLSELEIYSQSEFDELNEVSRQCSDIYPVIRSIRKLSWMEQAYKSSSSEYHRLKAQRSVFKILSKEGINNETQVSKYRARFSEQVKRWLSETFSSELARSASIFLNAELRDRKCFSDYLATTLVGKELANLDAGELQLPISHCLLLLSLTPRTYFENPTIKTAVDLLRQERAVREKWKQVSRIECLVFQAVLTAQTAVSDADRDWLNGFVDSWRVAQSDKSSELT